MKALKFIIIFCLLNIVNSQAQDSKLSVSLSTDSLLMGNYVEVKFTIDNATAQNFEAPNFEGFEIISGPNMSSSYSVINGDVTQSATYSYYLKPIKEGSFFISAATLDLGEKILETEPIELMVYPNPDGIIQQPSRENRFFEFFDAPRPQQDGREKAKKKPKKKRKTYRI